MELDNQHIALMISLKGTLYKKSGIVTTALTSSCGLDNEFHIMKDLHILPKWLP